MYIQYGSATCTQGIKCLHLTRAQNTCRKKRTRFTRGQNAYAKPQMHFTCEVNERQTRPRMTRPKREANVFVGKVSYHFSIHVSYYALLYDLYQHDSLPRLIFCRASAAAPLLRTYASFIIQHVAALYPSAPSSSLGGAKLIDRARRYTSILQALIFAICGSESSNSRPSWH